MNTEREKLIERIEEEIMPVQMGNPRAWHIADFILADRKRIVEPLVKYYENDREPDYDGAIAQDAIDEAIKLAGVE